MTLLFYKHGKLKYYAVNVTNLRRNFTRKKHSTISLCLL